MSNANIGQDDILGGAVIDAASMATLITGGDNAGRAALAAALNDLLGSTSETAAALEITGAGATALNMSGGGTIEASSSQVRANAVKASPVTATALAGAATANGSSGIVTSESLSTAAGSTYSLALTNSHIKADSILLASVCLGSSTTGLPQIVSAKVTAAGAATIIVKNIDGADPFNGTIKIGFFTLDGAAE